VKDGDVKRVDTLGVVVSDRPRRMWRTPMCAAGKKIFFCFFHSDAIRQEIPLTAVEKRRERRQNKENKEQQHN
jgi:hypothetical protein